MVGGFKGFGLQKQDPNVTQKRNYYVGGSDVPTILGINPYKTQYELALEKTEIKPKEFISNEYTQYGNQLEPQIREYINATTEAHFIVDTAIDKDKKIRSNVDGVDYDHKLLLEVKTHGKNPKLNVYEVQMQLYMHQLGLEEGWLAMYERPSDFDIEFDAERLKIEVIKRDESKIKQILDAIETFWIRCEYLKDNPEMTESEFMTVGTDMDVAVARLNKVAPTILKFKEEVARLEAIEKEAKELLYQKMTEYSIKKWETPFFVVTRVLPSKSNRFDSKRFKEEHPDIYDEYLTTSERKGYVKLTERKK
ncbi:endonuclease [Atopobacter sp. AH10]|nr:YqaJ viral recombinase family protein [Atopobacter sp. AH10]RLK63171.1 endonuclease [Atopobacter sp. AH10]